MKEDDNAVKELVESTGCDTSLAGMLIRFTGGDVEGAKRIIRAVPKDIFALKFKFITQITGYFGALFFCYDEKERRIGRLVCVVTDEKQIGTVDLSKRWPDFEAALYDYMRDRRVDGSKIERLKAALLEKEVVERLGGLLKPGKPVKEDALRDLLSDVLYTIFADTNIAVKCGIDMTDAFELNRGEEKKGGFSQKALDGEDVANAEEEIADQRMRRKADQSLIVLKVDPVLSPVKGTEIKGLEFGDDIQVRISDERDIADYLATLLGGKVDSIRVPIYVKIVEVKELEGDSVGVLTQFGPGIMGMFKVPSDVKVVTRHEEEEQPQKAASEKKKELNPIWVVGGIVVIIGIFVLLISMAR
ncbi:MAG: hypothetical protein JXQ30_10810 [Spirochaetes bacterium]|nr:hypothetical protein [Spirochaetota bacterium]